MKAVIVEIHNNTAVILSEEGCVVNIKNNNYQIGQEVEIQMKKELKPKKWIVFASAAASLLFLFGIGAHAYYTPYTYVSLDVNPSIEYSVNRFEKVLSVNGVNDDGTEIINEISFENLEHKNITDAISLTVNEILEAGYLDDATSGIVITTSSENEEKAEDLAQNLEASANETCEDNDCDATVTVEAVGATRVAEARALGVTPGKLNLVEKLIESSGNAENIDMEEWLHKSVKDIMAQTKAYKKLNKEQAQTAVEYTQNEEETQSEENDDNLDQAESLSENSINKKSTATKKQTADDVKSKSDATKKQSVSSNSSDTDAPKKKSENSDNGKSDTVKEQSVNSGNGKSDTPDNNQSVNSGNDKSDTAKLQNENTGNTNENAAPEKEKSSGNSSSNADTGGNSGSGSGKKGK